jgi:hypothetical protein
MDLGSILSVPTNWWKAGENFRQMRRIKFMYQRSSPLNTDSGLLGFLYMYWTM